MKEESFMANIKKLVKIMLVQWKLMVSGLFTMMIFAVLSGISVTMAVPLFDYVFGSKRFSDEIKTFSVFSERTAGLISELTGKINIITIFRADTYNEPLNSFKQILSNTDPLLLLTMISVSMIILIVLKNLFFYFNKVIFVSLRAKTIENIRNILFKKYLDLSMNFSKTIR
jgi:ABC-type multidrug transport system fused ATPase/permease subunit